SRTGSSSSTPALAAKRCSPMASRATPRRWGSVTASVSCSPATDGRNMDIWLGTPHGPGSAQLLLEVDGSWMPLDVSPDNRSVLLLHYVSINEAYAAPSRSTGLASPPPSSTSSTN